MTACYACNTVLAPNDAFCPACGSPVSRTVYHAASAPAQTMCAACNSQMDGYDAFCRSCGHAIATTKLLNTAFNSAMPLTPRAIDTSGSSTTQYIHAQSNAQETVPA